MLLLPILDSSTGKPLSTGVIIAITVSGFILGSCIIYLTLPLIGYLLYKLKQSLCHSYWNTYDNYREKKFDKKSLTEQDKKDPTYFI